MVHNVTECHEVSNVLGYTKGVLYVEISGWNHEGDMMLKSSVIISPSYVLL